MTQSRKQFLTVFGLALLLTCATIPTAANSVRSIAMGDAYTAIASDVSALFVNPAGIGQRSFDLSLNVGSENPETLQSAQFLLKESPTAEDLQNLPATLSISGMGGVGLGPLAVAATVDGTVINNTPESNTVTVHLMKKAAAGMGLRIARAPLGAGELRLGFAAEVLDGTHTVYTYDGSTISTTETTGKGYALSAGALAKITPWVNLGVSARNVGACIEWSDGLTETPQAVYTGGVAVKLPIMGITLAAEADTQSSFRYGAETNLIFNLLSLRAGQVRVKDAPTTTTVGASLNLGPFSAGVAATGVEAPERVFAEGSIRF